MKKLTQLPILLILVTTISFSSCSWFANEVSDKIVEKTKEKEELKGVPYIPGTKLAPLNREKKIELTKRINWEVKIPAGYNEMTVSELNAIEQKGEEAMRQAGESPAKSSRTVYAAKKADGKNSLITTLVPYNPLTDGLFSSIVTDSKTGIEQTYKAAGMPFNAIQNKVKIDDLTWNRIQVTIYTDATKSQVLMLQNIYMALLENEVCSITASTTNIADNLLLTSAINNSKFR
jgi:hypothetical protein